MSAPDYSITMIASGVAFEEFALLKYDEACLVPTLVRSKTVKTFSLVWIGSDQNDGVVGLVHGVPGGIFQ